MDQAATASAIATTHVFDRDHARAELTQLFRANGETPTSARPAIVAYLADLVKGAREGARARLEADGDGRACAERIAGLQDDLIHLIYDYVVAHVERPVDPGALESLSVVATGGYGRGLLAPGRTSICCSCCPRSRRPGKRA